MKRILYLPVFIFILAGCIKIPQTAGPLPKEAKEYKGKINLPGSDLTVKQAVFKSTGIFTGMSLNDPGTGISRESGINYHCCSFGVDKILYGPEFSAKIVTISYTVQFYSPADERAPRKNEKVIVFLNGQQTIKIILADEKNLNTVKKFIGTKKKN